MRLYLAAGATILPTCLVSPSRRPAIYRDDDDDDDDDCFALIDCQMPRAISFTAARKRHDLFDEDILHAEKQSTRADMHFTMRVLPMLPSRLAGAMHSFTLPGRYESII